ncbi:MAG: hypothetical protein A2X64_09145 [Ignavibacteria bacterium GWF2_33_9]|nr:MAG: hypothetical protein A2X64_09145 [Ignavibacteria bacterium GWF2_33_9]
MKKVLSLFLLLFLIQPILEISGAKFFLEVSSVSLYAKKPAKITTENLNDNQYYNQGVLAAENNDFETALKALDTAILINPKNNYALYARSTVHYQMSNFDSALVDLNNLLKLDKKNIQGLYLRSNIYTNLEQYKKAIDDYELLKKLEPKNNRHYTNLGYCYQITKNPEKAIQNYLIAEKMGAEDIEIKINLANLYYEKKNYDISLEYIRKVLAVDKGNTHLYSLYIYNNIQQNKCDIALKVFNLYKDDLQNPSKILTDIGICLFNQNSDSTDSASIYCFTEALNLDSNTVLNRYYLGAAYLKLKNTKAAQEQFENFLLSSENNGKFAKERVEARKQIDYLIEINKNIK